MWIGGVVVQGRQGQAISDGAGAGHGQGRPDTPRLLTDGREVGNDERNVFRVGQGQR